MSSTLHDDGARLQDFTTRQIETATALRRRGNLAAAARELELALSGSLARVPVVPDSICRRLSALYRALGRHDDEVRLLERYRDSQPDPARRDRFNARLESARRLAGGGGVAERAD